MLILESGAGNYIWSEGHQYSCFAGNNYLGLANHPKLVEAAIEGTKKYGLNFSASRQTTGTSEIHLELEKQLAGFKHRDDAVVFASGYLGNKILLHILRDEYDAIYADQSAHSSIPDGIPSDLSALYFYEHCNAADLESLIRKNKSKKPLVITDGIFALTGEIAPLDKIYPVVENNNGLLIVDDAHATGVLGKNGRGTPEYFDLGDAPRIFQTETMSKAIGVYGGFIASSNEITQRIREKSLVYGASTSLPPSLVTAATASIKLITEHPELRERMLLNSARIRAGFNELGFLTTNSCAPVIPILFSNQQNAADLSDFLKAHHIIAPFVNYPVKTVQSIVRITASAAHTDQQIDELLTVLEQWKNSWPERMQ
ncbi:MAG: pyridoxal phosphate-dependent aminotransferase family protein [Bacteroidia bacterium]|nr:pyridoxal phosphate-dependent aminotransferase family protein [Bacteroidia bacterium]